METWYSLQLPNDAQTYQLTHNIQDAFFKIFGAAGCPSHMAVFSRNDIKDGIITFYFTPSAHAVAEMFGAIPCNQPSRTNVGGLLSGDKRCWDTLFPKLSHDKVE